MVIELIGWDLGGSAMFHNLDIGDYIHLLGQKLPEREPFGR